MAFFGQSSAGHAFTVPVPPWVVWVSKLTAAATDTDDPKWDDFIPEPRLAVDEIYLGSSVTDQSYCRLRLVPTLQSIPREGRINHFHGGGFSGDQTDVEDIQSVVEAGDRVAVGMVGHGPVDELGNGTQGAVDWKFGGYALRHQILIGGESERATATATGPEWWWGGETAGSGAGRVVAGQIRRNFDADKQWADEVKDIDRAADPTSWPTITPSDTDKLIQFSGIPAVFNPDARPNMTWDAVNFGPPPGGGEGDNITGHVFETPDRQIGPQPQARLWTIKQAAKYLLYAYNNAAKTFIEGPADWDAVPLSDTAPVSPDTVVDGLPLYAALMKVLGPDYGFYIDPAPRIINGPEWSGFAIHFFSRSEGEIATVALDERGTPIDTARASVVRLDLVRDAQKTANAVTILGQQFRTVRLLYWGAQTPGMLEADKPEYRRTFLQRGWAKGEANTADFATGATINRATIESKSQSVRDKWNARHVTKGPEFNKYAHLFRLFEWNESAERKPGTTGDDAPAYGVSSGGQVEFGWVTPDLTAIADGADFFDPGPGATPHFSQFARRRRPVVDTFFADPAAPTGWRRVPPALYVAAVGEVPAGQTAPPFDPATATWVRVQTGHYKLDKDRAALWITHENLLDWRPMEDSPVKKTTGEPAGVKDPRSFLQLLHTGKLRLMLEGAVAVDWAMESKAPRVADAGLGIIREAFQRVPAFLRAKEYADSIPSPSQQTLKLADAKADGDIIAAHLRTAGQDTQIHASILVAADWPAPAGGWIGKIITKIQGRNISLISSARTGRPNRIRGNRPRRPEMGTSHRI
jgi:hypothetical protein